MELSTTFSALGDPTRLAIVSQLAGGRASVSELAEPFEMSQQAISKHIGVLCRAGLVRQTRQGRVRSCELVREPLDEATAWIEAKQAEWTARFDRLDAYLKSTQGAPSDD